MNSSFQIRLTTTLFFPLSASFLHISYCNLIKLQKSKNMCSMSIFLSLSDRASERDRWQEMRWFACGSTTFWGQIFGCAQTNARTLKMGHTMMQIVREFWTQNMTYFHRRNVICDMNFAYFELVTEIASPECECVCARAKTIGSNKNAEVKQEMCTESSLCLLRYCSAKEQLPILNISTSPAVFLWVLGIKWRFVFSFCLIFMLWFWTLSLLFTINAR